MIIHETGQARSSRLVSRLPTQLYGWRGCLQLRPVGGFVELPIPVDMLNHLRKCVLEVGVLNSMDMDVNISVLHKKQTSLIIWGYLANVK